MPVQDWSKIKDKLDQTIISGTKVSELGAKMCPTCNRLYEHDAKTIVCKKDGTLLMKGHQVQRSIRAAVDEGLKQLNYELFEYIGEGDLTYVFEAMDTKTKNSVVVKVIKPEIIGAPRRVQKFARALHEIIDLQHPNIVNVMASGIAGVPESGMANVYIIVEKLRAINLKQVLSEMGTLAPYMVIEIMKQVCTTLKFAQEAGALHRNLKPSNIYVSSSDENLRVKMSDFGIAERMFRHLEFDNDTTKTMSIYGNAGYLAPEVAFDGKEHSAQSEIYSLGCVMYQLLKGAPPFEGWNDFSAMLMHKDKQPAPFDAGLNVPPKLEAVVMRCLKKKPEERFQTFIELRQALDEADS
ncbi:MAG TPA: serine/threonine-protein kinase [Drouetiella sp.]